jgi:hypothetical protein
MQCVQILKVFGAIFGGERFIPIIGNISLAHDMKTALQEADELETPVQRDAKGREILSPEEKARREEKQRKIAAEVCYTLFLNNTSLIISESGSARRTSAKTC